MIPTWLDQVLASGAVLDLHHPDARRELAEKILEAVPGPKVAAAIAGSAQAVLEQRIATAQLHVIVECRSDDARRIAREVGNNAAQAVLAVLGGDA